MWVDLFFKIGLPVMMIGIVTLASHRYGPAVGGILGAVPAKGGPILLFLALEQNTSFAATSAAASSAWYMRCFAGATAGRSPGRAPTVHSPSRGP